MIDEMNLGASNVCEFGGNILFCDGGQEKADGENPAFKELKYVILRLKSF